MRAHLGLTTRIGVALLVSLALVTAAVTAYVVAGANPAADSTSAGATQPLATTSSASSTGTATSTPSAREYVDQYFLDARDAGDATRAEQTLSDLLPNHVYSINGATAVPLATGIAIGTVIDVTPVSALSVSGATQPFATEPAAARTVVVHLAVENGLGEIAGHATFDVGLKVIGDAAPELLVAGLKQLGRILLVVDHGARFSFDPTLAEARRSTQLIGLVDSSGTITFPYFGTGSTAFEGSVTTVDRLLAAAGAPTVSRAIVNGTITAL
ncbi:hypothetical protein BH11ACT2_BH11ACT2_20660 [soil metagenome]